MSQRRTKWLLCWLGCWMLAGCSNSHVRDGWNSFLDAETEATSQTFQEIGSGDY